MTRTMVEVLLFVSVAIKAALLIFIAGVLRKVMDDMDEGTNLGIFWDRFIGIR